MQIRQLTSRDLEQFRALRTQGLEESPEALREAHDKAYARALYGLEYSRQSKFGSDLMQNDRVYNYK